MSNSDNLPVLESYTKEVANPTSPVYLDFNTLTLVVLASNSFSLC